MQTKVPVIYSDSYYVDIGDHVFPTSKYRIIKERILKDPDISCRIQMLAPREISGEDVLRAHTAGYIHKLKSGKLSEEEIITMEVPYSPALVESSFICCAGTLTAVMEAVERGCAFHLGGGFHHAFSDHGEGFCVLNDIAVGIRAIQAERPAVKVLVVDCDVHQGNGTAAIFRKDDLVFTLSIHQENNYPYFKQQSDMDIGLEDGTGDEAYLEKLRGALPGIMDSFRPGLIVYVAGADPYARDQLGGLALSRKGLRERDNYVLRAAKDRSVPIAVTLAGGYAFNRQDTVEIHLNTLKECVRVFGCEL